MVPSHPSPASMSKFPSGGNIYFFYFYFMFYRKWKVCETGTKMIASCSIHRSLSFMIMYSIYFLLVLRGTKVLAILCIKSYIWFCVHIWIYIHLFMYCWETWIYEQIYIYLAGLNILGAAHPVAAVVSAAADRSPRSLIIVPNMFAGKWDPGRG